MRFIRISLFGEWAVSFMTSIHNSLFLIRAFEMLVLSICNAPRHQNNRIGARFIHQRLDYHPVTENRDMQMLVCARVWVVEDFLSNQDQALSSTSNWVSPPGNEKPIPLHLHTLEQIVVGNKLGFYSFPGSRPVKAAQTSMPYCIRIPSDRPSFSVSDARR